MLQELDVRKAPGLDNIFNLILQEYHDELAERSNGLIKCSLKERHPLTGRKQTSCQFTRGVSRDDPLNYRSVSLMNAIGKLRRKVVRQVKYLEETNIITERQFEFRRGSSCTSNLFCYYSRMVDVIQEREIDGQTAFTLT